MNISKKIVTIASIIVLFLAPFRIETPEIYNDQPLNIETQGSLSHTNSNLITLNITHAQIAQNTDCDGTYIGCAVENAILSFFELIWFTTTQVLAGVISIMLDVILKHSIDSTSYSTGIIEAGWAILRDMVNVAFIFALLVIAFDMVLGRNDGNAKAKLLKVILVALTINFSLFMTYFVIDASNITARIFYNRINVDSSSAISGNSGVAGNSEASQALKEFVDAFGGDVKSPSVALLSNIEPQRIITNSGQGGANFFTRFLVIFAAGGMNIMIIGIFLSLTLLFLGRTIGLIFTGVVAPLAFASLILPDSIKNAKYVGFSNWLSGLINMSFMAPVFLFFLFLIITFTNDTGVLATITKPNSGQTNVIAIILQVAIPFAFIAGLLSTAKAITTSLAGEVGGKIAAIASKALGAAATGAAVVATGGAALGASGLGGALRTGAAFADKKDSMVYKFGKNLQAQNFNFGQSRVGEFITQKTGVSMGAGLGNMSYARADTSIRSGRNKMRAWGLGDGTSEASKKWQENVQNSRNELDAKRLKEVANTAASKLVLTDKDNKPVIENGKQVLVEEKIKKLQEKLDLQTTAEKATEKASAKAEETRLQRGINREKQDLKDTNKQISDLTKSIAGYADKENQLKQNKDNISAELSDLKKSIGSAPPTAEQSLQINKLTRQEAQATAAFNKHTTPPAGFKSMVDKMKADKVAAEKTRDAQVAEIEKLTKEKSEVKDSFTVEGQIKQLNKIIDGAKSDAHRQMFADDQAKRNRRQSSSFNSQKTREKRAGEQARQYAQGNINVEPRPGQNSDKNKK